MGVLVWLLIVGACVGGGWFVRRRRRQGRQRTAQDVYDDTAPEFKNRSASRSLSDSDMRTTGATAYAGSDATDAGDADAGGTDVGGGGSDAGGFSGGGGGFDAGGFGGGADGGGGGI